MNLWLLADWPLIGPMYLHQYAFFVVCARVHLYKCWHSHMWGLIRLPKMGTNVHWAICYMQ